MNTRIYDIVDELTEPLHHWTWYQLNGTSAHNNYIKSLVPLDFILRLSDLSERGK